MSDKPKAVRLEGVEEGAVDTLRNALEFAAENNVDGVVVCLMLSTDDGPAQTWRASGVSTYEAVGLLNAVAADIPAETAG